MTLPLTKKHKRSRQSLQRPTGLGKKCLINMANAGKFSSDRTIKEYAEEIWGIEPAEIEVNQ